MNIATCIEKLNNHVIFPVHRLLGKYVFSDIYNLTMKITEFSLVFIIFGLSNVVIYGKQIWDTKLILKTCVRQILLLLSNQKHCIFNSHSFTTYAAKMWQDVADRWSGLWWQDVADRWSGSVKCALELMKRGMFSLMLVKTARNFPKEILGGKPWHF